MLGASPGASTSVDIMITLLKKCFPEQMATAEWQSRMKEMIPSYDQQLSDSKELTNKVRKANSTTLGLKYFTLD